MPRLKFTPLRWALGQAMQETERKYSPKLYKKIEKVRESLPRKGLHTLFKKGKKKVRKKLGKHASPYLMEFRSRGGGAGLKVNPFNKSIMLEGRWEF